MKTCPECKKTYKGYPALSRKDNKTAICSECGTREAFEALGISKEEIEWIIKDLEKVTK